VHTCLHEKGKVNAVKKVGGGQTPWPGGQGMYLTLGDSVQRPLTSGPKGWLDNQIPWPADQLLCRFGLKHRGHMSTQEGEGQGGEENW
jgi:hypothetical protein